MATTQRQLFNQLIKDVFGGLVDPSGKIIDVGSATEGSISGKFSEYVRKSTFNTYKTSFENALKVLEDDVEGKILACRKKGLLNYSGAVEIQTNRVRMFESGWKDRTMPYNSTNFFCSTGYIWCTSMGQTGPSGEDQSTIGETTLTHTHGNTKAETMTQPIPRTKFGGELIGNFGIGSQYMVSEDSNRQPTSETRLSILDTRTENVYLSGKNVLDWRTPTRTHNNMPPTLNVYLKCGKEGLSSSGTPASDREAPIGGNEDAGMQSREMVDSKAEAQYSPSIVGDLPGYSQDNISKSDRLLRL